MRALSESQPAPRPAASRRGAESTHIIEGFRIGRRRKLAEWLRGCKTLGSILVTRAELLVTYYAPAVARALVPFLLMLPLVARAESSPSPSPSPAELAEAASIEAGEGPVVSPAPVI